MKRIVVSVIVLALCAVVAVSYLVIRGRSGAQLQVTRLRIPDTRFMGILPLYVADENGFFEREGIEVQWLDIREPGQAGRMFFAGQADLIMSTFANLIPAEVRQPGTIVLLFPIYESSENPGSYILVRPDSEIQSIEDLRGHSLGTYSGPSQKAYAFAVLDHVGLKEPDDVRLVQVHSSAQVQSLFGGAFDALFTVEPYGSIALARGARAIEVGVRPNYISDPFWLGSAAIPARIAQADPSIVDRLLRALNAATLFIHEHEVEARQILARRTGTDQEVAEHCALYTWVAWPTRKQVAQIQEHMDMLERLELIDEAPTVETLIEGVKK